MEHLLQKSKCSIFHNIFKYMIFQRRHKAYYGVKGKPFLDCCNPICTNYNLKKEQQKTEA